MRIQISGMSGFQMVKKRLDSVNFIGLVLPGFLIFRPDVELTRRYTIKTAHLQVGLESEMDGNVTKSMRNKFYRGHFNIWTGISGLFELKGNFTDSTVQNTGKSGDKNFLPFLRFEPQILKQTT